VNTEEAGARLARVAEDGASAVCQAYLKNFRAFDALLGGFLGLRADTQISLSDVPAEGALDVVRFATVFYDLTTISLVGGKQQSLTILTPEGVRLFFDDPSKVAISLPAALADHGC
jgi:hypothetical protein